MWTDAIEIRGATILDPSRRSALPNTNLHIVGNRIASVGEDPPERAGPRSQIIDGRGKFIIPGLMDANVHLLLDVRLENLVRFEDRLQELIAEAAQLTLRNGLTSVFDTWGPARDLVAVRDRLRAGSGTGSRIFCAGNIIGLDGPFSPDFIKASLDVASGNLVDRINARWTENVGPELTWMTSRQVADEVELYAANTDVDFLKYAATEHRFGEQNAFLMFSEHVQRAIVDVARRLGKTVQSHTSSVEGILSSAECGTDILQHANVSGPIPIPQSTVQTLEALGTACTVFPFTERRQQWIDAHCNEYSRRRYGSMGSNIEALVAGGVRLLLATDAGILAPDAMTDPLARNSWVVGAEDNLAELGEGHFHWLKAMEEKGFPAWDILAAATLNIAEAYGKADDLGSIAPSKLADLLILGKNPLESAEHYRTIDTIIQDGRIVDRGSLPHASRLYETLPLNPSLAREDFRHSSALPGFCC